MSDNDIAVQVAKNEIGIKNAWAAIERMAESEIKRDEAMAKHVDDQIKTEKQWIERHGELKGEVRDVKVLQVVIAIVGVLLTATAVLLKLYSN